MPNLEVPASLVNNGFPLQGAASVGDVLSVASVSSGVVTLEWVAP